MLNQSVGKLYYIHFVHYNSSQELGINYPLNLESMVVYPTTFNVSQSVTE